MSISPERFNALTAIEVQLQNIDQAIARHQEGKAAILQKESAYYDEAKDMKEISDYYAEIDFTIPDNVQLLTQELISRTHTAQLRYDPTDYVYPWVDLQPDGKLKSIYSGKKKDVEDVLQEDYQAALKRKSEIEQLKEENGLLNQQLSHIANQLKFNCEHVVPQSWFNEKEPMRGDLHHLFTCEPVCNSIRSNFHYHDFRDYSPEEAGISKVTTGCGKAENQLFEPEYAKGIVSRAMLYFFLRYKEGAVRAPGEGINRELLLKWHNEFPVTIYEKHRNQAIYEMQGNRNPYIDFPHLAETFSNSSRSE
ncbi:endonuclease I family protein [Jeotgalibacillus campisalis]|uniref:Nuclease n=1 Tax=Jeotgalibacillus campisalis TaxID=220754 RepID=A0A0C2W8Y8_9BACL|nr:endonuclease [Jeotgalibacillus campisalis]KIL53036.1 nuclease [Jeotgalibacillus campisalis]